jgi:hypothetical protein
MSAATFDEHEGDTFPEHRFMNVLSPSWSSSVTLSAAQASS